MMKVACLAVLSFFGLANSAQSYLREWNLETVQGQFADGSATDRYCSCFLPEENIAFFWYNYFVWTFDLTRYWSGRNTQIAPFLTYEYPNYFQNCAGDEGICSPKRKMHWARYSGRLSRVTLNTNPDLFVNEFAYSEEPTGNTLGYPGVALDPEEDFIFFCGGNRYSATNDFQIFDLENEIWYTGPSMRNTHGYSTASSAKGYDGKSYVYSFGEYNENIERIDITDMDKVINKRVEWELLNIQMSVDRQFAMTPNAIGPLMYVIGGSGVKVTEVLDASVNPETIERAPPLNIERRGSAVFYNPNDMRLYVFGGLANSGEALNWEYSNQLVPKCPPTQCTKSYCGANTPDTRCSATTMGVDIFGCASDYCRITTCDQCGTGRDCVRKCKAYVRRNNLSGINCRAECRAVPHKFKCFTPVDNCV